MPQVYRRKSGFYAIKILEQVHQLLTHPLPNLKCHYMQPRLSAEKMKKDSHEVKLTLQSD